MTYITLLIVYLNMLWMVQDTTLEVPEVPTTTTVLTGPYRFIYKLIVDLRLPHDVNIELVNAYL